MPTTNSTTSPSTTNTSLTSSAETLESDLLAHLASTTALEDLHATLLSSLQRSGWTEKIRRLSLELLRAGRCERFDEVVEAVVASAEGRKHPATNNANNHRSNNNNSNSNSNDDDLDGYFDNVDVRIPEAVVEQGVRAIKDVLREVVILEDDDINSNDGDADGTSGKLHSLKNGDTSPTKKMDKKSKLGKQVK